MSAPASKATFRLPPAARRFWPEAAAVLAGVLLALCFPPFDLGGLVWIWVAPLLAALWFSEPRPGKKGARPRWRHGFRLGYVAGFAFVAVNASWVVEMWPVAGTIWAGDDPEASDPDGFYLDLWAVDIGPPAVARAALEAGALAELQEFLAVSPDEEPILVIDAGRHGLVSADFVRNTAPDRISAQQDGLPVALRDADLAVETLPGVPEGTAMILRTDRRLGFDPTQILSCVAQRCGLLVFGLPPMCRTCVISGLAGLASGSFDGVLANCVSQPPPPIP